MGITPSKSKHSHVRDEFGTRPPRVSYGRRGLTGPLGVRQGPGAIPTYSAWPTATQTDFAISIRRGGIGRLRHCRWAKIEKATNLPTALGSWGGVNSFRVLRLSPGENGPPCAADGRNRKRTFLPTAIGRE